MFSKIPLATLTLFLSLFTSEIAHAYQVEPMVLLISDKGRGSNAIYRVDNTGNTNVDLEVEVFERQVQDDGSEVLVSAEEDFIILPPMASIPASEIQTFRVRYLGAPTNNKTKSYRIVFKQLPIEERQTKGSEVQVLFNFSTLALVSPDGAKASLVASYDKDTIEITNTGEGVADLRNYRIQITSESGNAEYRWLELQGFTSLDYLVSDQTTHLSIGDWYKLESPPTSINFL